jgi:glycosyltransferase involved in cell wall biosynthesis
MVNEVSTGRTFVLASVATAPERFLNPACPESCGFRGTPMSAGISSELPPAVDVTIVMPCLNEADCLPACIANAREALDWISEALDLKGEIVIADNGSTDGSQAIATALGARVIHVKERGYGSALRGGAQAALGRYIVMGDADGSYDFRDSVAMVRELSQGADLCMGSRFRGGIAPGAMPWKNRYIGNPVLTGILNLLFRAGVSDAHCGLRAITKRCFARLRLCGAGMEFASEMVVKAALLGVRIAETPATLSPDLRNRPPHLRPWRDGWRHLRYLMMLSPSSIFGIPALALGAASLGLLAYAGYVALTGEWGASAVGNYWVILAGAMLGMSHVAGLIAAASHLYGVREGYRRPSVWTRRLSRWVSLETMLLGGVAGVVTGLAILFGVVVYWSSSQFATIGNVLPAVAGTSLVVVGMQNALGGFLLAILNGNEANFLEKLPAPETAATPAPDVRRAA